MKIKHIIDEDFSNYKTPSMLVAFPNCSFKCEKECGMKVCQNGTLHSAPDIEIDTYSLVKRYFDLFEIFLSPIITTITAAFDLALFCHLKDL